MSKEFHQILLTDLRGWAKEDAGQMQGKQLAIRLSALLIGNTNSQAPWTDNPGIWVLDQSNNTFLDLPERHGWRIRFRYPNSAKIPVLAAAIAVLLDITATPD